jgi:hypothetical protein
MKHAIKIENKSVANKVFLRKEATKHLTNLRVLDLFAASNVLWRNFDKERYYGVDILPGKGKNLCADSKQVVKSIDLSDFNVIDCDSFEIPYEICKYLCNNAKKDTVVIYTVMTNIFTQLPNACIDDLGIREMYKVAPSLFSNNGITYFYDMLANQGVKDIEYYEHMGKFKKHYGYFLVP